MMVKINDCDVDEDGDDTDYDDGVSFTHLTR
jgi:hypothetical protein